MTLISELHIDTVEVNYPPKYLGSSMYYVCLSFKLLSGHTITRPFTLPGSLKWSVITSVIFRQVFMGYVCTMASSFRSRLLNSKVTHFCAPL